ncbi:MAG TPA: FkbM family methyltransferase [Chthoniobacterales bacterium]|jgi:FkbM family methyltransferase|nr:FkbM family methyltransferase [Chthoniobacterales bacterium]
MARAIHTFDNGVRVYEDQLIEEQRARYRQRNVHEAEEEEIFVDLIRRLPPEGCFVDVGAAIGYYLILARKLSPRLTIQGVEPLARHRQFLRENLELNGLTSADFVIHPEGLTSSKGESAFDDRGYSSRLARDPAGARRKGLLEKLGLRRNQDRFLSIPTITLDTLVSRIGRSIDLVQMDVQGLEVEVLKGATESMKTAAVKTFLIGTHGRARGLTLHEECRELLRRNGYEIEIDLPDTKEQPDGILVATKRCDL